MPEPKSGKNRAHLQTDDRVAEVLRLVDLGATVLDEHAHSGFRWNVLADAAGNEFCIGGQEA